MSGKECRESSERQPDRILHCFQKPNSGPDSVPEKGRPSVVSAVCNTASPF